MKNKSIILFLVFVTTFFMALNVTPRIYFISKKFKHKTINQMIPQHREVGQNDYIEKFATPNIAKSYCYYDLSDGPVEFRLNTGIYYWSFSLYENDFKEFYHTYSKDDPDIESKVLLVSTRQALALSKNQHKEYDKIIISNTDTGLGVIRNFIKHWNQEDIHHSLSESKCSALIKK